NRVTRENFTEDVSHLVHFSRLDDTDISSAIKTWAYHTDDVLSMLCTRLMRRELYHTELHTFAPRPEQIAALKERAVTFLGIDPSKVDYYVWVQPIENSAYEQNDSNIKILMKDGNILDIAEASDLANLEALSKKVRKFAVSFPKELLPVTATQLTD